MLAGNMDHNSPALSLSNMFEAVGSVKAGRLSEVELLAAETPLVLVVVLVLVCLRLIA